MCLVAFESRTPRRCLGFRWVYPFDERCSLISYKVHESADKVWSQPQA